LVLIVLVSLTAFSQTGTTKPKSDSITLPKSVAVSIAQELIKCDSIKAELAVSKANTTLLTSSLSAKDSLIMKKDSIITIKSIENKNLNQIIDVNNLQKANLQNANTVLNDDLRKVNHKLVRRTAIGGSIIFGLVYLFLKK
jgi:hypothetical protein